MAERIPRRTARQIVEAVQDVCGIIEHYKHVAAQPASRQGKVDPEPGPAPEPDGEAAAS